MPVVVPVKFAYASRDLWFDPADVEVFEADYAICSTERGTEIGLVTSDPFEVTEEELAAPLKPVLRVASDEDLDKAEELADRGENAMPVFREFIKKNELDMKPVGVEFLFGGEKAICYFAAEERVDFRQLVKDLSAAFHARVDMRQIGVRDETRIVGGYAQCGQELCCTRFGGQFEPVSIRMAKEQDLPLNSSKISGVCGRLMCCLRYEFEAYKDFKSRAPKKKTLIDTPLGKAKIQEYDTPREQLILRLENGKTFRVSLKDMTCTAAAQKKAEESGVACRPDCVTRDILDRIDSPEMKLALMELDRQNGIDVGDGLDRADRIAASGPTPRRKRMREEAAAVYRGTSTPASVKQVRKNTIKVVDQHTDVVNMAPSSSRRKHHRVATETPTREAASQASASAATQQTHRRRHHVAADHAISQQASAQSENPVQSQRKPRRRRRSVGQTIAQRKPESLSVAEQLAEGEVAVKVVHRHPGDGGGARSQEIASETNARPQNQHKRRRRSRKQRSQQPQDSQETS